MTAAESAKPAGTPNRRRVLTGDRPTGRLHLGHWIGSLRSRVALQNEHECFNIVADLHTLTTKPGAADIARLPQHVRGLVLDVLAAGVDPERTVIYLQSGVPAVYDLAILLGMLVPTGRLRGLASVQDMARAADLDPDAISWGLLGYPVLQAADILMARAQIVPVGQDNVAHVTIAAELAQRFNVAYGEVFPIPEAKTDSEQRLPGLGDEDEKMSKSRGNAIWLTDDPATVRTKLREVTDEHLPPYVEALIPAQEREQVLGASPVATRDRLAAVIDDALAPMRARRERLEAQPGLIEELLFDGTVRAREVAYATLGTVREAMGLESLWQGIVQAADRRAQQRKKPY